MNIKSLLMAAALGTTVMVGSTFAQGCATGDCTTSSQFGYVGSDCATCDNGGFGYARGGGHFGGHFSGLRAHHAEFSARMHQKKQENYQVVARNQAWPRPFDCADRQLYFSIWEPMLDAGYQKHTTLTQAHFNAETQELNALGRSAVAGIMRNLPEHRKTIFVHRDVDGGISDSRIAAVKDAINTWYGDDGNANVVFTKDLPTNSNGDRIEIINGLYRDGIPAPVLPVATGTGGVDGG